jgi:hypothetical protein
MLSIVEREKKEQVEGLIMPENCNFLTQKKLKFGRFQIVKYAKV